MTSPLTSPLILIHKLSLGSSSGPRQSSVHFSCSHVKGDSACHPHPSLPFLKHRYRSLAELRSCELSHHISLMRLQSCDCTQISNSSCLFPLLHALGYRSFREAPNSADFAEKVWELPQLYQHFFICVLTLEVGPLWTYFVNYEVSPDHVSWHIQPCPPFPCLIVGRQSSSPSFLV